MKILDEIYEEYLRASGRYDPFHSAHEGYAVILEELDELKAEVFKKFQVRNTVRMREEAIQVAAMAVRFVKDICDEAES